MSKVLYCSILHIHPFVLCLSEESFEKIKKQKKLSGTGKWIIEGKNATSHVWEKNSFLFGVICVDLAKAKNLTQVLALLAHEATHIWQDFVEHIGEENPSSEFEAYALQSITQALFVSLFEQKGLSNALD